MSQNFNIWDLFRINQVQLKENVVGRWQVGGAIRSHVNDRDLLLECAKVLHETLLVSVLMYGSKTTLWKEMEKYILGLCRLTTSEACLSMVSKGWIELRREMC